MCMASGLWAGLLLGRTSLAAEVQSTAPAQLQGGPADRPRVDLPGTMQLRVLGGPRADRPYELWISLPAGKNKPLDGHPVLFVLDGNAHFGSFHEARRAQEAFAECMVVAVGYAVQETHDFLRRAYDYSPPAPAGSQPPQGGDEEFLDTLQDVVIPAVAARWHIDRRAMSLFGHSFGGMFALRTLFKRPLLFTHHVAASPTLWWRDDYLLAFEQQFVAAVQQGQVKPIHQSLLLIVGDQEPPQEIQDVQSLQLRLEPLSRHGLRTSYQLQPGEDHMSLPIAIAPKVLRQIFTARRI